MATRTARPGGRQGWRAQLARNNTIVTRRLLEAYGRVLPRLQHEVALFERSLAMVGDVVTSSDIRQLDEWRDFQTTVRREMTAFAAIVRDASGQAQADGIRQGRQLSLQLAERAAGDGAPLIRAAWNQVAPAALERLIQYVDGDAMRARFASFGDDAVRNLAEVVLAGASVGKNPRAVARMIEAWFTIPYAWAETMTRTVHIWSLRAAVHASYQVNSDIVTGWIWSCSLDGATCISCWAQHGRRFPVDVMLNDHHRGRCAPLPIVRGTRWADRYETGEVLFARLSPNEQREIMGKGMHELYVAGKLSFDDLSRPYTDGVYGEMLRAATLRELRGGRDDY